MIIMRQLYRTPQYLLNTQFARIDGKQINNHYYSIPHQIYTREEMVIYNNSTKRTKMDLI